MTRQLYRLYDNQTPSLPGVKKYSPSGVQPVKSFQDALRWNEAGWGIFHAVNEFEGLARRIDALKRINSWYCETDGIPKTKVIETLKRGLIPSLVVESKRGYHIYWDAEDATVLDYESIQDRLISFFDADEGVKDLARILRAPGFNHVKNPKEPFLVKEVFRSSHVYKQKSMQYFFKVSPKHEQNIIQKQVVREALKDCGGHAVWKYFIELNCENALNILSGSSYVNGEVYSFKASSKGTKQIYVNSLRSQCWIDLQGKIGSHTKGGPTIFNWLKWFGHSNREVVSILKQYFPQGFKDGSRSV